MKKILSAIAGMALILNVAVSAWAGAVTTTMTVTAEVPQAVTVSATPMNFGTLSPNSPTMATATITVNAASDINYYIAIDAGQHFAAGQGRTMELSGDIETVFYNLCKDASRTEQWGDSDYPDGNNTYPYGLSSGPHTGDGTDQQYPVYGTCSPYGFSLFGTYSDVVTVTVFN
ncbi:MAG: spore coat protein U domain-containing protein [Gemmatimonadota bacterium]|nr:MAG: spore coat protein U domain-containing protein [Gemmatimonadota bacterium]